MVALSPVGSAEKAAPAVPSLFQFLFPEKVAEVFAVVRANMERRMEALSGRVLSWSPLFAPPVPAVRASHKLPTRVLSPVEHGLFTIITIPLTPLPFYTPDHVLAECFGIACCFSALRGHRRLHSAGSFSAACPGSFSEARE